MKNYIKSIVALTLVCAVLAIILACVNSITAPIIKANEDAVANEALLVVLPSGEGFEEVDLSNYEGIPSTVKKVHKEANGGYVVELVTKGYGSGLTIMCGIDNTGTITGAVCLSSSETLGYEKTYGENMVGKTAETVDSVDTISGATLTTKGYKGAVADAFSAVKIIKGEA